MYCGGIVIPHPINSLEILKMDNESDGFLEIQEMTTQQLKTARQYYSRLVSSASLELAKTVTEYARIKKNRLHIELTKVGNGDNCESRTYIGKKLTKDETTMLHAHKALSLVEMVSDALLFHSESITLSLPKVTEGYYRRAALMLLSHKLIIANNCTFQMQGLECLAVGLHEDYEYITIDRTFPYMVDGEFCFQNKLPIAWAIKKSELVLKEEK